MVHLYWGRWWIAAGVGREDHRGGCRARSDSECLNTENAYEVAHTKAASIRLDIALIPRQSEGCPGHLNDEKVEASSCRQARYFDVKILSTATGCDCHA